MPKTPPHLHQLVNRGRDTLRAVLRELSKTNLWFFLTDVLMHPAIDCDETRCCEKKRNFFEPLHKNWCDWAQDDSNDRRLLLAPRGHFKSTVISYAKSCHLIIRNPNVRILLVSALDENAKNFCKQVKNAFRYNDRMKWLFPECHVPPGEQFGPEYSFITPARTDHSLAAPTFTSAYLDASLASQHYDFIIMDDPIEAKHVATEDQAAKARASYNKIVPLLDPATEGNQTAILVVGTRWAYYDLYSGIVPVDQGGTAETSRFNCIVRSCFETDGKPDFENGDPIYPTRFPRSELIKLLEEARADDRQGEQFWWNQYMNLCRSPDSRPFFEDWFIEVDATTMPPPFAKMISIDTALKDDSVQKKGARGDYTAVIVAGWDREGRLYLIDGTRSNAFTSKILLDFLVSYCQKYNVVTIVKQKVSEDTFGTQLRDAFAAVNLPLDYRPIPISGMGRKVQRIKDALQAPMQRNEIFWLKRFIETTGRWEHHKLFEQAKRELLNLGQYPVDDVADALANFYHPDVKVRKANLAGPGLAGWKIPGAPSIQLGNNQSQLYDQLHRSGSVSLVGRSRRGAGWGDD